MCVAAAACGLLDFETFILFYIAIFIKTANQSAVVDLPREVCTPQFGKQCLVEWCYWSGTVEGGKVVEY
jgi:hypothetical protein